MIGYQGTVFPVLLAVWFMSIVEKQLRRVIPDAVSYTHLDVYKRQPDRHSFLKDSFV